MACIEKYRAPNGKFSTLHDQLSEELGMWRGERLYVEVHDDAFKNWFGNWESKAKNGLTNDSLIGGLDENWEPRVFWHGTNTNNIREFNRNKNFFTTTKESAQQYAVDAVMQNGGEPIVYPVFLRIRQSDVDNGSVSILQDQVIVDGESNDIIKSIENDGSFSKSGRIFESLPLDERPSNIKNDPKIYQRRLGDSSAQIKSPDDTGLTTYTFQGKSLQRVSSWVDEDVPYRGDESGKEYSQEGTRYHKIVELIIRGYDDSGIDEQLKKSTLPPIDKHEEGFRQQMRHFVNRLRETGIVMTEVRVADVERNIAGTIDIVHIKDNGHIDVYDLKTAHETPWKRNPPDGKDMSKRVWDVSDFNYYKAERYAVQTLYYATLLANGDTLTGRPSGVVDNVYVVPIEVYRDKYDQPSQITALPHVNIKEWRNGSKSYYEFGNRVVRKRFKGEAINQSLKGRTVNPGDAGEFLRQALGVNINNLDTVERRAIDFVERNSGNKMFTLGDNTPVEWISDDKAARVEQVKSLFQQIDSDHAGNMSSGIETFFNGEYKNPKAVSNGSNFTLKKKFKEKEGTVSTTYARTSRLQKILNYSNAKDVTKLSDIPGFEQYADVMMIKRGDGAYDLLTFTNIPHFINFDVKNKNKNFIKSLRSDGDNILGNHISPYEAETSGISLTNNFGDFTKMRLGLIALELQASNPDINVNRIVVDYMGSKSTSSSMAITLDDLSPQIRKLASIPDIKNTMPEPLLKAVESSKTTSNITDIDSLNQLNEYILNELSEPFADKLSKEIDRFSKNEITRDQMANELLNGVNGIRAWLRRKHIDLDNLHQREALSSDKYFMTLAQAWITLKGLGIHPEHDVADEFVGQLSYWIKSPTNTGRKTLDKFFDLFRRHVDNVKHEVQKFIDLKDPVFRDLVAEDPFIKKGIAIGDSHVGGTDAIFAMTRTVMEPLIKTSIDKNGNKFYTPYLKDENDPSLTVVQKRAIKFFNDQIQIAAPGKWMRGQIPIIRTSSSTKWFRAKDKITKGRVRDAMHDTKDAMSTFISMAAQKGNFKTLSDDSKQFSDVAYDQFAGQTYGEDGQFTTEALSAIGLDNQMNLTNADDNGGFETDLEKVLTLFRSHYIKKAEMDKALPIYQIYRSIFKYYELAHGLQQSKTIQMMDDYVADIVFNTKTAEDAMLSKALNVAMRISSIGLLGLNPNVFIGNSIQMTLASVTDALTNSMTSDTRFPGMAAWGKATVRMTAALKDQAEMTKMLLLRQKYMTEDLGVLTGEKHQMTSRGMINEQLAYALDRSMESGWRTHHLIAQMEKDGIYEAHTISRERGEDGYERWVLKYDPKLDPRFKGQEGQLFYEAIKESMREKGELDVNGEITGAYDWKLRERLKAYINRGIGTFDKDLASPWARHSLMFTLSQFRNWFTNKFQRITKLPYDAEIFGDYVKVGDKIVWSSEPMKGMLWTLTEIHQVIPKLLKGEYVSNEDKRNLAYMTNSLVAATILAVLSAALIADDDDDDFIRLKSIAHNNIADMLSFLTGGPFGTILTSPAVFASYFSRMMDTFWQATLYGIDGDTVEMWNTAKDMFPIYNQLPDEWTEME